ncbi:MAG: hypothetical protein OEW15_04845 [Nitrospirota bacterium]|nr:hypothetical protein [Nitrospirota bacterium]
MNQLSKQKENAYVKLDHLRNDITNHLYEIETMIKLGEITALSSGEGRKIDIEWSMVFSILGRLQKATHAKCEELETLIRETSYGLKEIPVAATK